MKSIALLGFAIAMSPALVFADESPAPDAATTLPHPNFAAMQQVHAQMKSIRDRERVAILGSLSAAHRAAFANIVGQLAVAPNPDRLAAARAIDATLTPAERNNVLSTESAARAQTRSLREASRAQFEASLTPDQRTALQARMAAREAKRPEGAPRQVRTPDAGMTLLDLAMGGGGERHGFGPGGPGGPGGEPPPQ